MNEQLTRQSFIEEVRAIDPEARTLDIIASDYTLDSYGTRIDPNGWDVEQFRKNPVICLQHDSAGETPALGLPIAKALPETIRIEDGKLLMRIQFPKAGEYPLADQVFNLAKGGFLRGVSVGFVAVDWEDTEELDEDQNKRIVRVYRKQQLLEVSIVTIPSNDNAVIVRSAKRKMDAEEVKKQLAEIESEFAARAELAAFSPSHAMKCIRYFERKRPVNKEASRAMQAFYKRILKEEQPADEMAAWTRMTEAIEAMQEATEEPKTEEIPADEPTATAEVKTEETPATEQAPTTPTTSTPDVPQEAPAPSRSATVTVTLDTLRALPGLLAKAYEEQAVAALQRGVPVRKIGSFIDGMNKAVISSLPTP